MALLPPINFNDPELPTLKGRKSRKDRVRGRYTMKRNASNLDLLPPEVARVARRRDTSPHDDTRVSLAKYRLEKAQALGQPFEYNAGPGAKKHRPPPLNIIGPPSEPAPETNGNAPALSGDAIARILKQTKPDCPKAQAWIKAHEVSKMLTEKAKTLGNTPAPGLDTKKNNNCPAVDTLTQQEEKEDLSESDLDRVRKAHERLMKDFKESCLDE